MMCRIACGSAWLMVLLAAPTTADGGTFEDLLKANGLSRSGINLRLDSERTVLDAFEALKPKFAEMKAARDAVHEANAVEGQFLAAIDRLGQLRMRVEALERQIDAGPITRKQAKRGLGSMAVRDAAAELKQARAGIQEAQRQISGLRPRRTNPRRLAQLESDDREANRSFHAAARAAEADAARVVEAYARLRADEDLKAAVSQYERSARSKADLGPSAELRRASEWLRGVKLEYPPVPESDGTRPRSKGQGRRRGA